jgi:NADPH-dependent ferric siderophore reductase
MTVAETRAPTALQQVVRFLTHKGRRVWSLGITGKTQLTPAMMRVEFAGDDLDELVWKRGQDLVLELPQRDGTTARRHYTIRKHDGHAIAIDFVLHGASPAGDWARAARPGDRIEAAGPRGHTYVRDADWHLFAGDESCIPAIFAMIEGLDRTGRAFAFIEIANDAERQTVESAAAVDITWLPRNGAPPGPSSILYDSVERFAFPQGLGHASIIGETHNVRAIRRRLIERGLGKDQCSAEGYWRQGRIGGHDHA